MKLLALFLYFFQLLISEGSYREHGRFKASEVGEKAAEILKQFDPNPELKGISVFSSRRILPKKWSGQEVRITRKKNGSLDLTFQLGVEQITKGYIDSNFENRREIHLFSFLSIKGAKIRWHLDGNLQVALAKKTANFSPMAGFTMKIQNKTIFELATSKALKSRKEVSVNIWQDDAAIKLIQLYFSKNPKDELLWEDD